VNREGREGEEGSLFLRGVKGLLRLVSVGTTVKRDEKKKMEGPSALLEN